MVFSMPIRLTQTATMYSLASTGRRSRWLRRADIILLFCVITAVAGAGGAFGVKPQLVLAIGGGNNVKQAANFCFVISRRAFGLNIFGRSIENVGHNVKCTAGGGQIAELALSQDETLRIKRGVDRFWKQKDFTDYAPFLPTALVSWMATPIPTDAVLNPRQSRQSANILDKDSYATEIARNGASGMDSEVIGFQSYLDVGSAIDLVGFYGSISGDGRLPRGIDTRAYNEDRENRIGPYTPTREPAPEQGLFVVLCAILLGAAVLSFKGMYCESYFMTIGGWFIAAASASVLAFWFILGHAPLIFLAYIEGHP